MGAVFSSVGAVFKKWAPRVVVALVVAGFAILVVVAVVILTILGRQGDLPPLAPWIPTLVALAIAVALVLILWRLPKRQVRRLAPQLSALEQGTLEDTYRRTVARIMGGAIVLVGVLIAGRMAADLRARQLSERVLQAAPMLGSDQEPMRLAGVVTLGGVARDAREFRRPVLEILAAFVQRRIADDSARTSHEPASDLMAATRVLVSMPASEPGLPVFRVVLAGANLRGALLAGAFLDRADLRGAHLEHADLTGARIAGTGGANLRGVRLDSATLAKAHLDGIRGIGAVLVGADLRGADLDGARLDSADLRGARLQGASMAGARLQDARLEAARLDGADLQGASLTGARLDSADFASATLKNADLRGTDMRGVRHLTIEQLVGTRTDSTTWLPAELASLRAKSP